MTIPIKDRGVFQYWDRRVGKDANTDVRIRTNDCLNMDGLTQFIRQAFPQSAIYHVESLTGVPSRTVRGWLDGHTRPSGEHLARLIEVFGPQFLQAAFHRPIDWVSAAVEQIELELIDAQIERLEELRRKRE